MMALSNRLGIFNSGLLDRLPLLSRLAFDGAILIAKWQTRSATRRDLRKLDSHLLCDIGLQPDLAAAEAEKKFWQA